MHTVSDEYVGLIRKRAYTVDDVKTLRKRTPVGAAIKFKIKSTKTYTSDYGIERPKIIKGVVTAKYPHIFVLDDNRTFTWVDYLLGRIR